MPQTTDTLNPGGRDQSPLKAGRIIDQGLRPAHGRRARPITHLPREPPRPVGPEVEGWAKRSRTLPKNRHRPRGPRRAERDTKAGSGHDAWPLGYRSPRSLPLIRFVLSNFTRYIASLPAPRQIIAPARRAQVAAGARHFESIGCAQCHTPSLGAVTGLYSDLLLHRVEAKVPGATGGNFYGSPSSAPRTHGAPSDFAQADEFRTPPLWGVADSGPYMHDGGSPTLEAAILRHTAQARVASTKFQLQLSSPERGALIAFLESLRAP